MESKFAPFDRLLGSCLIIVRKRLLLNKESPSLQACEESYEGTKFGNVRLGGRQTYLCSIRSQGYK